MKPRHQLSKAGIELIKRFEGYRRSAAALGDGRYTVGYGHTKAARASVEIDERDAEALLIWDLLPVTAAVNDLTFTPLTQNQFDALVSFAFNVGVDNFRRSSVLRRVNEGNLLQAAQALEMWRKADFEGERIVVDALIRRRAAEKALFLTPADGYVPAPSPVLPPHIDYEAVDGASREQAHRLVTPLTGPTAEAHLVGAEPAGALADPSPVTAAAEAVAARFRALELETEVGAEAIVEPQAEAEPGAAEAEPLILTPPEPNDGPFDLKAEAPLSEAAGSATDTSGSLPFETPKTDDDAPITLGDTPSQTIPARRQPTAYIAEETFPSFDGAPPMQLHIWPLAGLFAGGLALVAFAVVWGASTSGGSASAAAISWVAGLLGVACMVSAFYLFVSRLGGDED